MCKGEFREEQLLRRKAPGAGDPRSMSKSSAVIRCEVDDPVNEFRREVIDGGHGVQEVRTGEGAEDGSSA